MADPSKIQAIRERLDIVQIIEAYVQLKKQGQRFVGCCPFHNEKTPSFSVSPDKGLFYCFGCHAGGDAFAFVMRHEGLDFQDAVRKLGDKVGVPLEAESPEKQRVRKEEAEVARCNEYALAFFQNALGSRGASEARAYLKSRGVTERLAGEWRLGFGGAPGELLDYLEQKRVPRELAKRAGLLSDDGGRSLFDNRVIFAVFDTLGRLAGFGGRRLGDGDTAKYLNSRETPLFKKSRLLFGWEHAQEAIRRTRKVIVVEGYMDVIACHSVGLQSAVAALGTAFTDDHADTVARFAKDAVVLMDGDKAGRAASFKVAERLLARKLATAVAGLPPGIDPDACVQKLGGDKLKAHVQDALPAVEHFLSTAFTRPEGAPALTVEERAQAARELAPLLLALGPGLERDLYMARLAERVGVSSEQLQRHLQSAAPRRPEVARPPRPGDGERAGTAAGGRQGQVAETTADTPAMARRVDKRELGMLKELLLYPELRPRLALLAEYALDEMIRATLVELADTQTQAYEVIQKHLGFDKQAERLRDVRPVEGSDDAAERAEKTYHDVLARLKARHVDAARKDVIRELTLAESAGVDPEPLMRKMQDLTRRKQELLSSNRRPSGE